MGRRPLRNQFSSASALFRFDGERWVQAAGPGLLSDDQVYAYTIGPDGRHWFGTDGSYDSPTLLMWDGGRAGSGSRIDAATTPVLAGCPCRARREAGSAQRTAWPRGSARRRRRDRHLGREAAKSLCRPSPSKRYSIKIAPQLFWRFRRLRGDVRSCRFCPCFAFFSPLDCGSSMCYSAFVQMCICVRLNYSSQLRPV